MPQPKNVTPSRGATTKTAAKRQESYKPRFKSDKPQARSTGGRGNERVSSDDVSSPAEQATSTKWDRLPNALEYLRRFVDSKDFPLTGEQASGMVTLLLECLRRYVQHLEEMARNADKKLTPPHAVKLMDLTFRFKEQVSELVKSPVEKVYDILRFTVVPEVFADQELTTITIEGIGRCNLMDDVSVSMVGEDKAEKEAHKAAFYQWLIDNQLEDIITQTVNAQTLTAFVRRQLQSRDGKKLPYEHIKVTPVTRAQITRT